MSPPPGRGRASVASPGAPGSSVAIGAGVFAVALGLHLALAALHHARDPFARTLVADALAYHEWATRLAADGLANEGVFHQSPLFPLLLGAVYALTDVAARPLAASIFQALAGSIAIALLVPLGRSAFGSRAVGLAGAALALLHGPLVFYGLKLLPVSLALATQAAGLVALYRFRERGGRASAALAGGAWGLAALARGEMLAFVPLALALVLVARSPARPQERRTGTLPGASVAWLVGLVLVVAPVTLHNVARGDLVLVASAGGENLWIGNRPGAEGGHTPLGPGAGDLFSQRIVAVRLAEEESGRDLAPSEVSRHWARRALGAVLEDPAAWVVLEIRKLGRLLHPGDPTDLYSYALERERYLPALHALFVTPWLLLLLGGVGLALALRTAPERLAPLGWLVGLHALVPLAFFVDTRLRLPLLFFLAPAAGHAVVEAARGWRAGNRRPWIVLLILAAAGALVGGLLATRPTARDRVRLAAILSSQGELDPALEALEGELASEDPDPIALDQAGWIEQKRGDLPRARELYRRALASGLPPERAAPTRSRLAGVLEQLGDLTGASAEHDRAVEGADAPAGAFYERGMFRLRRGELSGGVADLREASRRAPGWPPPEQALRALDAAP